MSTAADRALAHRLVLASLTGDDDAFARTLRELEPTTSYRLVSCLADCTARVLARLSGRERAIQEVENLIWARLDDIEAGQP